MGLGAGAGMLLGGLGSGLFGYLGAKEQSESAEKAAQPLPTYVAPYSTPGMEAGYGAMMPYLQNLMGGQMPQPTYQPDIGMAQPGTMPQWGGFDVPQASMPTGDWYSGLDPNVRAGIEQPYMRGMEMLEQQLQGRGMLGSARGGISGAGADVLGEYMAEAGPRMAQTGWGMMQPGLLTQQGQQFQQAMMGAQRPWEAGMAGMGQEFAGSMQQQQGLNALQQLFGQQTWEGQMLQPQMMGLLSQFMPHILTGSAGIYGPEGDPLAGPPQFGPGMGGTSPWGNMTFDQM